MNHRVLNSRHTRRQRGLSLVELMIAMLVGLILMAGALSMFLSNRRSYMLQNAVARMQENGRFSLDFLRPQLRLAGYTGCGNQSIWQNPQINLLNDQSDIFDFSRAIQGYDYNTTNVGSSYTISSETPALASSANDWSPALPSTLWNAISSTVIAGSDIIMIHAVNPGGIAVQPPSGNGGGSSANIKVYNGGSLTGLTSQIGFLTNCQQAAVFQITNANVSSATVVHSETSQYSPGNSSQDKVLSTMTMPASLYTMQTYVYFIGRGADDGPALYMVQLTGNYASQVNTITLATPQELVPDVANMQILYGLDTDGDGIANQYVAAGDIANWAAADIVSVRIALLIASDNNVVPATALTPIDVDSVAVTPPPDPGTNITRRLYKVFIETVAVRNHIP